MASPKLSSITFIEVLLYLGLLILAFLNIIVYPYILVSSTTRNISTTTRLLSLIVPQEGNNTMQSSKNTIHVKDTNNTTDLHNVISPERLNFLRRRYKENMKRNGGNKKKESIALDTKILPITTTTTTLSRSSNSTAKNGSIPHNLIFMYKHNILETKEPVHFYNNIQNTIQEYRTIWKDHGQEDTTTRVLFYNDTDCAKAIEKAEPKLVEHFWGAVVGSFMADICRIAVLYNEGGYYMDIDLKIVKPIDFTNDAIHTTFSSVLGQSRSDFFQAFIACTAHHPILRKALDVMLEVFEKKRRKTGNLGPTTLKQAYKEVPTEDREQGVTMFHEVDLDGPKNQHLYPNLQRQNGTGCCCNFVIHSPEKREVYFFARFVGKGPNCDTIPT